MLKHILQIGIPRYFIADLWLAFCTGSWARIGNRDAFDYKKSNTRIRKQKKELNIFQKLFWIYSDKYTHVPKYRNMFYAFRIANISLVILYLILFIFKVNPTIIAIVIEIRMIFVSGLLFVFTIINRLKGRAKKNAGWNLD